MAIAEAPFDSEAELEQWTLTHLERFLGECVPLGKFQIITPTGKAAIPDGFAFNFSNREWHVIEAELLSHGVWPHIAEQITRFVVALQNPDTIRKIRDRLFEEIVNSGRAHQVAATLNVQPERLLQQLELFVEGVQPSVVIFIDETNQDLQDFANALDVSVRIYRIKKFCVDGRSEYYSPDEAAPALDTTPDPKPKETNQDLNVVAELGGGSPVDACGRFKCYKLTDGKVIHIKRSKFHERNQYYWYGIGASSLQQAQELGVTHFAFVLADWGFTLVDMETVEEFCKSTKVSVHSDGRVRHYHVLISREPSPEMFFSSETKSFDLSEVTYPFE